MGPRAQAPQGGPREEVAAWATARFGSDLTWKDRSHDHGVTRVWQVDGSLRAWLKVHTQVRKYRQERDAYAQWVPWLADRGHAVPRCLGTDDGLRLVALSHVEGEPFGEPAPALFEQAGRFLNDVHAAPFECTDRVSIPDAMRARAERWCGEARGHVTDRWVDHTYALLTEPGAFEGLRRTVCHRDFSPRNWLVRDGQLGFIDFEHSRHEIWLADFQRLEDWEFAWWPDVRAPFFRGFGRNLTDRETDQLRRFRWLYAVGTVAWAVNHGDAIFERQAREALVKLDSFDSMSS